MYNEIDSTELESVGKKRGKKKIAKMSCVAVKKAKKKRGKSTATKKYSR